MTHAHPLEHDPQRGRHRRIALSAVVAVGVGVSGAGLAALTGGQAAAAATPTTTLTLAATADAYTVLSAPNATHGTRTYAYATRGENRTLLRFDTTHAVPAGKKIVAAALRVYVLNSDVSTPGLEVHPVSNSWSETTLTAANRPTFDARSASTRTAVTTEKAWLTVPLTDLTSVSGAGPTSFELLHQVTNSRFQLATREAGKAPVLELSLADTARPQTPGVRPFDPPSAATLAASPKLVFAHYFTPFPLSLDNKTPDADYYERGYLDPAGESGKHAAYGGLLRDRPIGRAPLAANFAATDFDAEIRQARAAGLDGFTVDLLSISRTSYHWARVTGLLEAAHRVDPTFKIMLMPDMTTLQNQTPQDLAAAVAALAAYPAAFHLADGRLVVSPFKAEAKTAAWWGSWLSTVRSTQRISVAFVPTLLDWQRYASEFSSISYGFSHWGLRNPGSNSNNPKHADLAHSMGKIWMAPAHVQDARPSGGIFDEAGNTETLRLSWEGVINSTTDWVDMPTWNDYSEGTSIAPSARHGYAFLDLTSYYIARWKLGVAPAIVRDGLYLTHRTQPFAAKPTFTETKLMTLRANTTAARDTVEAVAFLVDPATVTVKVGAATYLWDAPAGLSAKTFPLGVGTVSGTVARDGLVTTKVTSPFTVVNQPYVQDLQYDAVSSLRP